MRAVFAFLALLCSVSNGLLVQYDEVLPGSNLDWFLIGMYKGVSPAPVVLDAGSGASIIDLNITVTRSDPAGEGHVEVLIFHEEDLAYIGVHGTYQVLLCCDKDVLEARACEASQLNYTALASAVPRRPDIFYKLLWFDDSQPVARLVHRYEVPRDGLYYVIFVNCNAASASAPRVTGQVVWLNKPGFLAGSDANLVMFGLGLGTAYVGALCSWLFLLWVRRDKMIVVHFGILALLCLGCVSVFARAASLAALNETGVTCVPCALIAVFFDTMHQLGLRLFALMVAMGLGITIPWWETDRRQRWVILILSVAYVVAMGGQSALVALSEVADNSGRRPVLLLLPVNLANTAFMIYIFVELLRTIHLARDEGDRDKFKVYISHLLFLFGIAAFGMFFYIVQLLVQWRDVSDITWKFDWMFPALWDAAMLVLMYVVGYLWFPSQEIKDLVFVDRAPLEWRPQRQNQ